MKKHSANIITSLRIIGICIIFIFTPFYTINQQCAIVLFYIFLSFTDFLDGFIARSRWGQVTTLGKILDPAADKMLVLVYLPLLEMHQITSFPVGVLLGRDIMIFTLRLVAAAHGHILGARWAGKIKTAISLPLAAVLLCRVENLSGTSDFILYDLVSHLILFAQSIPIWIINFSIWSLSIWTIYTLYDYFHAHWFNINNVFKHP